MNSLRPCDIVNALNHSFIISDVCDRRRRLSVDAALLQVCLPSCVQGINDFDLTAFADGGVKITGLRLVDVLNKTVRDFILERQSRRRNTLDTKNARRITVFHSVLLSVCLSVLRSLVL